MATADATFFPQDSTKGPWWVKYVTMWGLPGVIIGFLFWNDFRKDRERREDNQGVVDVLRQTTGAITKFDGTVNEMKKALEENTRSRQDRRNR